MRLVIAILICCSLCGQCFIQLGILNWYEWNKAYIISEHCVNKDRPELRCNGKCYLKKQLGKVKDTSKDENKEVLRNANWPLFILPPSSTNMEVTFTTFIHHQFTFGGGSYDYLSFNRIFHPPRFS